MSVYSRVVEALGVASRMPLASAIAFMPIALAVVALFAASEWSIRHLSVASKRLEAAAVIDDLLDRYQAVIVDTETAQRGYLLTLDPRYMQRMTDGQRLTSGISQQVHAAVADDRELRDLVEQLADPVRRKLDDLRATALLSQNARHSEAAQALRAGDSELLSDEIRTRFARLKQAAQQRATSTKAARQQSVVVARSIMIVAAALVIGLMAFAFRLVLADVSRREAARREAERRQSELEAQVDERTAELSDLSTHLQRVAETERAFLARELHDELGGLLTAAKMDLSWLSGRLAPTIDVAAQEKMRALGQGLEQAMNVKRRVVENLRPSLLDHFGFAIAIKTYFEDTCKNSNLQCVTDLPDEMANLSIDAQLALYRVAQEALTNTIRHGKASNVSLQVQSLPDGCNMTIVDDGIGFESAARSFGTSHGVQGMRHRILSLGGKFQLVTGAGRGTRIDIFVPTSPRSLGHP